MTTTADTATFGFVSVPLPEHPSLEGYTATEQVRYDQFVLQLFTAGSRDQMAITASSRLSGSATKLASDLCLHADPGSEHNRPNVIEALGNMRYYMQAIANLYGISESEILQDNALRMSKRYVELRYG